MILNRNAVVDVRDFLALAWGERFPLHSARLVSELHFDDALSCRLNNSSGHNMREIDDDSGRLSLHAIGFAFDINPELNPCIVKDDALRETHRLPPYGRYNPQTRGTLTPDSPLVELMNDRGWDWGGVWTTPKDYQHFQKRRDLLPVHLQPYVKAKSS
jgi:hypothetical protein